MWMEFWKGEANWFEKVLFRYVKLELLRHANGNFQQMVRNSSLNFKETDIRNVNLRINHIKGNS